MDKKQIKLFGDSVILISKILMQEDDGGDTQSDVCGRIIDSLSDEFLVESDAKDIMKYIETQLS
jgi:hypothetical protein